MTKEKEKKEKSEDITQHQKDAEKTLTNLETMKCNIEGNGTEAKWKEIVKVRKKHINAFLTSLKKEQEKYEHFK